MTMEAIYHIYAFFSKIYLNIVRVLFYDILL